MDGRPLATEVEFHRKTSAIGISGDNVEYGAEDAIFLFRDEHGDLVLVESPVKIALDPQTDGIPSLLGRDLLAKARLDFNMPGDELILEFMDGDAAGN